MQRGNARITPFSSDSKITFLVYRAPRRSLPTVLSFSRTCCTEKRASQKLDWSWTSSISNASSSCLCGHPLERPCSRRPKVNDIRTTARSRGKLVRYPVCYSSVLFLRERVEESPAIKHIHLDLPPICLGVARPGMAISLRPPPLHAT